MRSERARLAEQNLLIFDSIHNHEKWQMSLDVTVKDAKMTMPVVM